MATVNFNASDLYSRDGQTIVYGAGVTISIRNNNGYTAAPTNFTLVDQIVTVSIFSSSFLQPTHTVYFSPFTTHTISYNTNGGTGTMSNTVVTDTNMGDSDVTLASNSFTPPFGRYFAGWRRLVPSSIPFSDPVYVTNQPGQALSVAAGATISVDAVWKEEKMFHTYVGQDTYFSLFTTDFTIPTIDHIDGTVPPGVSINLDHSSGGYLVGTPTTPGRYAVSVYSYDSASTSVSPRPTAKDTITIIVYNNHSIVYDGNGNTGGQTLSTTVTDISSAAIDVTFANNGFIKAHYHFLGWKINNTGTLCQPGDTYSVAGNTYVTAYAQWEIDRHTVTLTSGGHGTVSGGGTYDYGTNITLTATPDEDYRFVQWSDGNSRATRQYVVSNDVSLTATFVYALHTVTVTANEHGSVTGSGTYTYGEIATISAVPDENYRFSQWNDGNTQATRSFTVTGDATYTATFVYALCTVTVSSAGGGTVTGSGTYEYGSEAIITAIPSQNYTFSAWSDGSDANPRTLTVYENTELSAIFIIISEKTIGSTIELISNEFGEEETIHFSVFNDEDRGTKRFSTILTGYSDNTSTGLMVTPIVTYTAENAFTFDISPGDVISLQFTRVNPKGKATYHTSDSTYSSELALPWDLLGDDRMWSNRAWENNLMSFINRWQAETNGCVMRYIPVDPETQYDVAYNVFIKSVSFDHSVSSAEVLKGNVELQVGSMTGDAKIDNDTVNNDETDYFPQVPFKDMVVTMSNSSGTADYILFDKGSYREYGQYINFTKKEDYIGFYVKITNTEYKAVTASNCKDDGLITIDQSDLSNQTKAYFINNVNCISKYTLKGGPEQPFPLLTMEISKKRLSAVAPDLVNDIYAGFNRIDINAMGKDRFIVTKCLSSSTTYKITAYSIYEAYRSAKLTAEVNFGSTNTTKPFDVIRNILTTSYDATYGRQTQPIYCTEGENGNIRYAYRKSYNNKAFKEYIFGDPSLGNAPPLGNYACKFETDTSAWYVLCLCAALINCKIWFSNNKVYIVDTSISYEDLGSDDVESNIKGDPNFGEESAYFPKLYLNTNDPYPLSMTEDEIRFTKTLCDEIQLGDEGAETVVNSVYVEYDTDKDYLTHITDETARNLAYASKREILEFGPGQIRTGGYGYLNMQSGGSVVYSVAIPEKADLSQKMYGVKETKYSVMEFGEIQATNLADMIAVAYCDSEQSIGFSLKETHFTDDASRTGKYWRRYFPEVTYAGTIVDYSHDLVLTTRSNYTKDDGSRYTMPNKLVLSTYTHHFPEGTTEYWFGILKPTDLTQNTSDISATLYKR